MTAKEHFVLNLTFALETVTHCKHEKGVIAAAVRQALKESETYIGYHFANDLQGQTVKAYLHLICNSEKAREYLAADLRQGLAEELWQNERIKQLEDVLQIAHFTLELVKNEISPDSEIEILPETAQRVTDLLVALETSNAS
jgi:hypothetical protein